MVDSWPSNACAQATPGVASVNFCVVDFGGAFFNGKATIATPVHEPCIPLGTTHAHWEAEPLGGRGYPATLPTCGAPLNPSPAVKRWGPPRRQGLCSHLAHLWATFDSTGVAASHCITWFQTQPILSLRVRSATTANVGSSQHWTALTLDPKGSSRVL